MTTSTPHRARHRAPEPAATAHRHGRRAAAAHESTAALRAVDRAADQLTDRPLPFPETAGLLIRHPGTGAVAISCNGPGRDTPGADRFPCYALVSGHDDHRDSSGRGQLWLTYRQALAGGWRLVGDIHDQLNLT